MSLYLIYCWVLRLLFEAVTYKKPQILFYTFNKANSFKALHIAWFFVKKSRRTNVSILYGCKRGESVLQLFLPIYFAKIDHKLTFSLGYRFIFASCLSPIFFRILKWEFLCAAPAKNTKTKSISQSPENLNHRVTFFFPCRGGKQSRLSRPPWRFRSGNPYLTYGGKCVPGVGDARNQLSPPVALATARNASRENLPRERSGKRFWLCFVTVRLSVNFWQFLNGTCLYRFDTFPDVFFLVQMAPHDRRPKRHRQ